LGIFHARAGAARDFSRQPFRIGIRTVCRAVDGLGAGQDGRGRLAVRILGQGSDRDCAWRHGVRDFRRAGELPEAEQLLGGRKSRGIAREGGDLDAALADIRTILRERPGRVWTGPSGRWGTEFQIAKSQPYSFVSLAGMDELSFLYHSLSWNSDVTAELDELDPYQAKLFAMRAALAPVTQPMPFYFKRRAVHGRLAVYEASNEGYFGLVDIGARYDGPLSTVLNRDWAWMQNPAVRAGA